MTRWLETPEIANSDFLSVCSFNLAEKWLFSLERVSLPTRRFPARRNLPLTLPLQFTSVHDDIILSCRSVRVIVRSRFSVGGSVFEIGITWLLFWNTEFYWVSSAIIWLNECCPTERTTTKGTSTRSWTSSRCSGSCASDRLLGLTRRIIC